MRKFRPFVTLFLLFLVAGQTLARERLRIVGSSDGVALLQTVAQSFADHWDQDVPGLEATGTAVGFKLFCAGIGFEHPDMVVSSRPITDRELAACRANGVDRITRLAIGHDAAVIASNAGEQPLDISRRELFSALAARVDRAGELVANPYRRFAEIDPALPDLEIRVMAPAPNTRASHAFQESGLAEGCKAHAAVMDLPPAERASACHDLRDDGHLVVAPKRENAVLEWLLKNPHAFAVVSYADVSNAGDRILANAVEGVLPSHRTLADGSYPLTTTLQVYVKDGHSTSLPSLQRFVYELTSEAAIAPNGYLAEQGLIALDDQGRNQARDQALRFGLVR